MKKFLFLILFAWSVEAMAQVTLTVSGDYVKIEKTGLETNVLFCKDIRYAYDNANLYFTHKSTPGWEFTIKYTTITTYNSVASTAEGFPSFSVMKAAILDSIETGKRAAGGNITATVSSTSVDSLLYKTTQMMGRKGHYPVITTTATTYIPLGWCVDVLEAAVIASLSYQDQTDSLVTITAAAGQRFYGKFKHIKLTSGKVIVYK